MNKRPDANTVEKACYAALAQYGVTVKYGLGRFAINEHYLGWIGLNRGVHPGFIRVNPNIGIHCIAMMQLVSDASGEKYRKGEYPSLAYPLGYACPDIRQFVFETEADLLPESKRLAEAIVQFGMPFIQNYANYPALLSGIYEVTKSFGGAPQRYAAGLFLSGDKRACADYINEQIAKYAHDNDFVKIMTRMKVHIEMHSGEFF